MLRVWMQDSVVPSPTYDRRPGRWITLDQWPTPDVGARRYPLTSGRILPPDSTPGQVEGHTIQSPLSLGLFAGKWCSYAAAPDLPHDQREEDGGALVFDSDPLTEPIELLGRPVAELTLSASEPVAMIAVRLMDTAPDGKSTRITYGLLNLCHREGHENPTPVPTGEPIRITVQLNNVAQVVPEGHRLRLAVSTSYWPLAWPPPRPVTLTLFPEESTLVLPLRMAGDRQPKLQPFEEPVGAPELETTEVTAPRQNWVVSRDLAADRSTLEVIDDQGAYRIEEHGMVMGRKTFEWYRSTADDFTSVEGETVSTRSLTRDDWSAETVARTLLTCSEDAFKIHATLDAYESGQRVFAKTWDYVIPRECV